MDFWQLYLLTIVPDISSKLGPITIVSLFIGAIGSCAATIMPGCSDIPKEVISRFTNFTRKTFYFGIATGIVCLLSPSKESLYTIMGGYYVTHIEGIDKLPPNVVGAMNKFLEQYEDDKSRAKEQGVKTL